MPTKQLIPALVQKAIKLLKPRAKLINKSTDWSEDSCPIASAYGLSDVSSESWRYGDLKTKLRPLGWDARTYRAFIDWHDVKVLSNKNYTSKFPNRTRFLKLLRSR